MKNFSVSNLLFYVPPPQKKTTLGNKFQYPVLFNIVGERTHLLFLKGLYLDDKKIWQLISVFDANLVRRYEI